MAGIPLITEEQFLQAQQQINTEITNVSDTVSGLSATVANHLEQGDAHTIEQITSLETELNKRPVAGRFEGQAMTKREHKFSGAMLNPTVSLSIVDTFGAGQMIAIYALARVGTAHRGEAFYIVCRTTSGTAYAKTVFERNITLDISTGSAVITHASVDEYYEVYASSYNVIN